MPISSRKLRSRVDITSGQRDPAPRVVRWSNSGPLGGSGVVDTSCGPVEVTVDEVDDVFWMRWSENRATLSRQTIDDLLSCRS
jgi:hypothetical protein